MTFNQDTIQEVKDKNDLLTVIENHCGPLKQQGKQFVCLSPFNEEKTPSFFVDPIKQVFNDYSSDKSGDVIEFIKESKGLSFQEAVSYLAEQANITIEIDKPTSEKEQIAQKAAQSKKRSIESLLEEVHQLFKEAFKELPANHPAKEEVIVKRGYSTEIINAYGIGYAIGQKYVLNHYAKDSDKLALLKEIGIISEKGYDNYWERVIYPIHDAMGVLVGFAGRDISGNQDAAKWINPRASIIYKKDTLLYGLKYALQSIRAERTVSCRRI
jgi:DNA primase